MIIRKSKVQIMLGLAFLLSMLFIISVFTSVTFAETDGYILKGDVDNNETVNASDALKVLKITAKLHEMDTTFSIRKNDFDNNYKVNAEDALHILKIAAKSVDVQIIDDPENFFDETEYKNGYPLHDYISRDLDSGDLFTVKKGKLDGSEFRVRIQKFDNSECISKGGMKNDINNSEFDRLYWEFRWMIEDSIVSNQLEAMNIKAEEFKEIFQAEGGFDAYEVHFSVKLPDLSGARTYFYVTNTNELYFYQQVRCDLFKSKYNLYMFKYTGEIPDALTYEAVEQFYMAIVE